MNARIRTFIWQSRMSDKKSKKEKPGNKPEKKASATEKKEPSEITAEQSLSRFPVAGIGASAGGLEAFTELLKHLPADTGMGFVLIQHLHPGFPSALTEILSRATSMPVAKQPGQATYWALGSSSRAASVNP